MNVRINRSNNYVWWSWALWKMGKYSRWWFFMTASLPFLHSLDDQAVVIAKWKKKNTQLSPGFTKIFFEPTQASVNWSTRNDSSKLLCGFCSALIIWQATSLLLSLLFFLASLIVELNVLSNKRWISIPLCLQIRCKIDFSKGSNMSSKSKKKKKKKKQKTFH